MLAMLFGDVGNKSHRGGVHAQTVSNCYLIVALVNVSKNVATRFVSQQLVSLALPLQTQGALTIACRKITRTIPSDWKGG
jgi:hypothetical protein